MTPSILRPAGKSRFVILCDHASQRVPEELHALGLPESELARHIAWDIGAAGIATALSALLDAPAILSPVSRLVIDCNRHLTAHDLIPEKSDETVIPGNENLSDQARAQRIERWFAPYHDAVESIFIDRERQGIASIALSIHSMTDNLAGVHRPWQISFSTHANQTPARALIELLRRTSEIVVGDNQPYSMDPGFDYSTPFHALRRGLPYLQVEFRQDEVKEPEGQIWWAEFFANALAEAGY